MKKPPKNDKVIPSIVPGEALSDKRLTSKSKLVYGIFNTLVQVKGQIYVSNRKIALWLGGMSIRSVQDSLAELEEFHYIKRLIERNELKQVISRTIIIIQADRKITQVEDDATDDDLDGDIPC